MFMERWLLYTLLEVGIVQAQCYFPGGDLAPNHQPCNPYAFTSLCCESGWTCFDNGLCVVTSSNWSSPKLSPVGSAARGTCTNPLWNDTACGNFCLDDPVNNNNGSVISCGNQNWCCQPGAAAGTCSCASGDGTFHLQEGSAQTIIGIEGLESTSTEAIPISSVGLPSTTASYPVINASTTPSTTGVVHITSSSASTASSTTSSSSASHSSQGILTMTLQPTIITMLPPSGVSTISVSSSPTVSTASSSGKSLSTGSIVGIVAGLVIAGAAVICGLLCLRRRSRRARRGEFIPHNTSSPAGAGSSDPLFTEHADQDIEYRTRWPQHRNPPDSLANRSGHELHPLVPDHDTDRPTQPNLYGPPASDPYAVPPYDPDMRPEASRLQRRPDITPPLNYRPTMRGANRPRGNGYRTMPRAPQARMPEVPETARDWPTGE